MVDGLVLHGPVLLQHMRMGFGSCKGSYNGALDQGATCTCSLVIVRLCGCKLRIAHSRTTISCSRNQVACMYEYNLKEWMAGGHSKNFAAMVTKVLACIGLQGVQARKLS